MKAAEPICVHDLFETRLANMLYENGYTTDQELEKASDVELLRIQNMGPGELEKIRRALLSKQLITVQVEGYTLFLYESQMLRSKQSCNDLGPLVQIVQKQQRCNFRILKGTITVLTGSVSHGKLSMELQDGCT